MSESEGDYVSSRRLQSARRQGRFARSRWWQSSAVWGAAGTALHVYGVPLGRSLASTWRESWQAPAGTPQSLGWAEFSSQLPARTAHTANTAHPAGMSGEILPGSPDWLLRECQQLASSTAGWLWGLLLLSVVAVIFSGGLQTRLQIFPARFRRPPWWIPGNEALSFATWSRLVLLVLHVGLLSCGVAWWVQQRAVWIWWGSSEPTWSGLAATVRTGAELMWLLAAISAVLGAAELGLTAWILNSQLGMSEEARREEIRAIEGDPRVEVRRRQLHRRLLRGSVGPLTNSELRE